jgi:hypothetical protein
MLSHDIDQPHVSHVLLGRGQRVRTPNAPTQRRMCPYEAAHRERVKERDHHVLTYDVVARLQGQALGGVPTRDRHPLQLATSVRPVDHEAPARGNVHGLGPSPMAVGLAHAHEKFGPLLQRHFPAVPLPLPKHSRPTGTPSLVRSSQRIRHHPYRAFALASCGVRLTSNASSLRGLASSR